MTLLPTIDPTQLELSADEEAMCRQLGADWLIDTRTDMERIDLRLSAIESELGLKSVGKASRVSQQKRAALEQEQAHLLEQRATKYRAFVVLANQAREQLAAFKQKRDAAAAESEKVLEAIINASQKADRLMTDLCRVLTERKAHIEKLRVLMGDESLRRYLHRDSVTEALARAGLREFAFLNGTAATYRLAEHDEQIVACTVRNEVLRLAHRDKPEKYHA